MPGLTALYSDNDEIISDDDETMTVRQRRTGTRAEGVTISGRGPDKIQDGKPQNRASAAGVLRHKAAEGKRRLGFTESPRASYSGTLRDAQRL